MDYDWASKATDHFKRKSWVYSLLLGIALGVFLCLKTEIRDISVTPSGGLDMKMRDQNDLEHFRSVWEDEDRRQILISLIAGKGFYSANNPLVVSAITKMCETIPREPFEEYLKLSQECAEKEVPKLLRDLQKRGVPPFHPVGRIVNISVPEENDQPPVGNASTCLDGELYRRSIRLVNRLTHRTVTVLADRHYGNGVGCGPPFGTGDLQLNVKDALLLFDGPIGRIEKILAIAD